MVILGSLVALAPLAIDLYLPALPEMSRDLHAPVSTVQLTLTTCLLGLGLGQLVAGPLADALGRRRPLLVGLAAFALLMLITGVAPVVAPLVGAQVLRVTNWRGTFVDRPRARFQRDVRVQRGLTVRPGGHPWPLALVVLHRCGKGH